MHILRVIVLFSLTGCTTVPADTLSPTDLAAVSAAEQFIARHGFTELGHPTDQPVVGVGILDTFSKADEIVSSRRNSLNTRASCLIRLKENKRYVHFQLKADTEKYSAVYVVGIEPVQVLHAPVGPDKRCVWLSTGLAP